MIQTTYKNRHIYWLFLSLLAISAVFTSSCNNTVQNQSKRALMIQSVDSLWNELSEIKSTFKFQMDEFVERKTEMEAQLIKAQFLPANVVTEEDRINFDKYNGVYRVYKGMAIKYKQAVLRAEDNFYAIKGLENQVKKGHYDEKVQEFKKELGVLRNRLMENKAFALEVTGKLSGVEPIYLRVAEPIDAILEKHLPEK